MKRIIHNQEIQGSGRKIRRLVEKIKFAKKRERNRVEE